MELNYFDVIFAIPLLWAAFKGFRKGFIVEVASLIALALGIYGAIKFSDITGFYINQYVTISEQWLPYAAFALTFLGIVVGIHFLAKTIEKLVHAVALKPLNKIAGLLFGVLKSALILSIVLNLVEKVDEQFDVLSETVKEESVLYGPIQRLAPTVIPAIQNVSWLGTAQEFIHDQTENLQDAAGTVL